MISLAFKQFIRTGGVRIGLSFLLIAGIASLLVGRQFVLRQNQAIADVQAFQQKDFVQKAALHHDDLGLLLYYLKFSLINETSPLAGLSIGQRDVNASVQSVTIRALEGQKYDADLNNPLNLLLGNLDFSFVLIYLFPLLIIAFTYNLISEERESGTWKLVAVQSQKLFTVVLQLFAIRALPLLGVLLVILLLAIPILGISFDTAFVVLVATSVLYGLFWFSVSFWVASQKQTSAVSAMLLLGIWLSLVILLPALINTYLENRYPVPEALATTLKQRKGYHEKWDLDKKTTLEAFYTHYPQFRKLPTAVMETDWRWYYAMQQLGDDESARESGELRAKLQQRDNASRVIAQFVPTLHTQLQLNELARTGLGNQLRFLDHTTRFHEKLRLYFYPKIFTNAPVKAERWTDFPEETFSDSEPIRPAIILGPLLLFTALLATLGWRNYRKTLYSL
ncbi:DUF3526 domain-containing protein [Spirosoma sp. RP8]|uniref:DUF3526 domain-containing protein n=1 Tax=Spirosoma liriopis TaxID=2937440 RepID=A0ABT0HRR0_9BACT|nr:DUF3526 domain-containing protein [Spirosoma liriopis]MCK8494866.1 DUF3526 domain-containing protein [Spirosoma liriopis]